MTTSLRTRLHITPLDAGLLPIVLGSHLIKVAENISFQSLETFPENNYGFVELPETDAKTLIAKLNGAILKGRKMKVEKARSMKRSHDVVQQDSPADSEKPEKKARRSKKDTDNKDGVIEGYQIPSDRKVKRGWTEPKSEERRRSKSKSTSKDKTKKSKRQAPSQYTEKEELLFRTELPPNKQSLDQATKSKSKSKGKDKKSRNAETVIHEFERNEIQPAFVRDSASSARAAEYIEDVGWVDDNGDVVEEARPTTSRKNLHSAEIRRIGGARSDGAKSLVMQQEPVETTSSVSTSASASGDEDLNADARAETTSESGTSSSAVSDSFEVDDEVASQVDHDTPQGDETMSLETPQKVHPLEALFKRPNLPAGNEAPKPSLEIETSFTFFDRSTVDADDDLPAMPSTPFTSNDLRSREVRSAAPTPDTAHPSRFTGFASLMANRPANSQSREVALLGTAGNEHSEPASERSDARTQSDFEKRFWAERGQNNRAWKTRRKTALKEQRQKENRLRRPRNW